MPKMSIPELDAFMQREFPQMTDTLQVVDIGPLSARLRVPYAEKHLRPGGTMSGPAMMTLADCAMYLALLGEIGPVPLAVTTNLTINFLRKPAPADLIGDAHLLKVGRTLAVGEVYIRSEGMEDPVAHATCTYAIPPGTVRPAPPDRTETEETGQ